MKAFLHILKSQYPTAIFIVSYLALILSFLHGYLIADINLLAGLILAPYILRVDSLRRTGQRYLWFALGFMVLSWYTGVATFYFLSIGMAMLYVFESMAGRINWLPLFLLGVLCPAFKYFNNIFGFAVRLKLSEIAGKAIQFIGFKVEVAGNVMIMDNCEFSVDPACVGLKMMVVSILAGLLLMAFFERKNKRNYSFISVLMIIVLIILLNITGNLLRIIMLVIFRILPENPAHDLVGILCLILYTIVPAYFIVKHVSGRKQESTNETTRNSFNFKTLAIHLLLLTTTVITGFKISGEKAVAGSNISVSSMTGFGGTVINGEVIKYEKPGVLIYVKPVKRFYGTEHNPMICWIGSGYEFKRIGKKVVEGKEVYTGILKSGNDILYAAWWFDNGTFQTINQADWRWRAFKGEEFYLINVNCSSEKELLKEVGKLLKRKMQF